jgi:hypothetical protein
MTYKHFKPIEIPKIPGEERDNVEPSIPDWPIKALFNQVNNRIAKELDAIQQGISPLIKRGIQLKANEPIMTSFKKFRAYPTKDNCQNFLNMAKQDVGLIAERQFKAWLQIIIKGDHLDD